MTRVLGRPECLAWALLVSGALCVSCYGRNHTQLEGTYEFTAAEIIRDECALQSSSSALWSGRVQIFGDLLRMQTDDRLYGIEAVGFFLASEERFTLDGSAGNVTAQANGTECFVSLVNAHLDSTTDSPTVFHGTTGVAFTTRQTGCSCQLWARYSATLR